MTLYSDWFPILATDYTLLVPENRGYFSIKPDLVGSYHSCLVTRAIAMNP